MKSLNQYIQEKLIINKDYHDAMIVVKSFDELRKIIEQRYEEQGPGTEQDPINFNDIDVSNLDSFCNNEDIGIFEYTKFKYIDISGWDVSNVTDMDRMFLNCIELESVGDISKWDVSNVKYMCSMFKYCISFNTNLSGWDVSNVKSTRCMFFMCKELKSVGDISKWDVSKVTSMSSMFYNCKALKTVGDISSWNVSNVEHMGYMFYGCTYFNQDISNWDVSKVRHHAYMFDKCQIKEEYKPKFK